MNKIKNILAVAFVIILIHSCGSDTTVAVDDFDNEAQALIDNDTLVQFLKNHYYDTSENSVKALVPGQIALHDDQENLKSMSITENDIAYTLYYYTAQIGTPSIDKGKPSLMDSVFVKYNGKRIVNTDSIGYIIFSNAHWL